VDVSSKRDLRVTVSEPLLPHLPTCERPPCSP
jgi:hypothetical protein